MKLWKREICHSNSLGVPGHFSEKADPSGPCMRYPRSVMRSPISPSSMRLCSSCKAWLWRDMRPTPTLMFFADACFARSSIRREVGPSAVSGFSMNTLMPFSMAYLKCTQRKASGVVKMATSPFLRQSMADL